MKVGLFPMVADVMHAGHILAIKEAKENCDYLIIALYCSPKRKPNLVQSVFERYIQLDAVKYVDKVIPYEDEEDVHRVILSLKFDIYFLGADYKNKPFEGKELLKNLGKEIYYLSRNHTMSSTKLKSDIINGVSNPGSDEAKVIELIKSQGQIYAIKWYKETYNCGLAEAKNVVDSIMVKHHIPLPPESSGMGCSVIILIGLGLTIGAISLF